MTLENVMSQPTSYRLDLYPHAEWHVFFRFLMIPGDWDWGKDPIGPAIRRPPLAVLINTGTWCAWWMMVWFQWTKAAIQDLENHHGCVHLYHGIARCSAIETHLRRHLFFQRSSSSSMFLGPSCDVSRVGHVNHVSIWYRELGTKVVSLTQPLHPVPWNKKEYMSTRWLGVWLPRSSCWWACHPTRIALARLKASEASPQVQFQVPASTVISILSACGIPVCTLLQGNVCTLSQKADYNTRPQDETTKSCHWQGHQPLKNTPPTSDWERWDSENRCHKQSYLTDTDTSLDSGNFNLGKKWHWQFYDLCTNIECFINNAWWCFQISCRRHKILGGKCFQISVKAVNVCPLANMLKKISRNMFRPATMNRKGKCSSAALLYSPVEQHASISSHL